MFGELSSNGIINNSVGPGDGRRLTYHNQLLALTRGFSESIILVAFDCKTVGARCIRSLGTDGFDATTIIPARHENH